MFDTEKYKTVRWLAGGRTYPDLDCFGIVNEIRRDLNMDPWPDFAGVTKERNGLDKEAKKFVLSLERCEPCVGAGVACYSGSMVTHVAIIVMVDNQLQVAECNPGSGVSFMPLSRFIRRFVKVEFWK